MKNYSGPGEYVALRSEQDAITVVSFTIPDTEPEDTDALTYYIQNDLLSCVVAVYPKALFENIPKVKWTFGDSHRRRLDPFMTLSDLYALHGS